MKRTLTLVFSLFLLSINHLAAQIITTIAGTGTASYSGDGGAATAAELNQPYAITIDESGNIYIADALNSCIRIMTPSGRISTIAGSSSVGYSGDGGQATDAALDAPAGVAIDRSGNLYIVDKNQNVVRKVNASGIISTYAGNGTPGYSGDGGHATAANLNTPIGIAVDSVGNLFIADTYNQVIRKVNIAGYISTYVGGGYGGDGGAASNAFLQLPTFVALDRFGNLFISEVSNYTVRKVSTTGIISTYAGNGRPGHSGDGAPASSANIYAQGIVVDKDGSLFITDGVNHLVRKINSAGIIYHYAGHSIYGYGYSGDGGPASTSFLNNPTGVTLDTLGNLYIVDNLNNVIRKASPCVLPIVVGTYGSSSVYSGRTTFLYDTTYGVGRWNSSNTSIATVNSGGEIRGIANGSVRISYTVTNGCGSTTVTKTITINTPPPSGVITTIVGTGTPGHRGDGASATTAWLYYPKAVAVDRNGNMYIADQYNNRIRKVTTAGMITTIAGNGSLGYSGDGGAATNAELYSPRDIAIDSIGNVFIVDARVVRKINTSGIISTIAGTGSYGYSGDGGSATAAALSNPSGIAIDNSGNIYIADLNRVRKVSTSGIITTIAGVGYGVAATTRDVGPATSADIACNDISLDTHGNIYITDGARIRKINTSGIISTIAGHFTYGSTSYYPSYGYSGDGGPAILSQMNGTTSVSIDNNDNIYIGDNENNCIRKINSSGIISTIAGTGSYGYSGDGGSATAAKLSHSFRMCSDPNGTIYVADFENQRIRKITNPCPTPVITGAATMCLGATTTLTSSVTGGTWSSSNTSRATISSVGVVTGVSAGTATISYSVTGACGTLVGVKTVTASTYPRAGTIAGPSFVGIGATIRLTDSVSGGYPLSSDTSIATVSSVGIVTGRAAGTAIISYIVTNGCSTAVATKSVSVREVLFQNGSSVTVGICANAVPTNFSSSFKVYETYAGRTLHWSAISSPAQGTLSANFTSTSVSGINTPSGITYAPSGSYIGIDSFMLQISDGYDSMNTKVYVNVRTFPSTPAISGTASDICLGSTATLTGSPSGGTWSSNGSAALTFTSSGIVTGIAASGAGVMYYTVSASGCNNKTSFPIRVTAPGSVISFPTGTTATVCPGSSITISHPTSGGSWGITNASLATISTTGIVTGIASGRDTVVYNYTNSCGTVIAKWPITITGNPNVAGITGYSTAICNGSTVALNCTTPGGVWSTSAPSVATISTYGLVTTLSGGSSIISYSVTNSCGLTGRVTKNIVVTPIPDVGTISGASTVVMGTTTTLSTTATGGTWSSSNTTLATISAGGIVRGRATGIDTIRYTITNACGTDTAFRTITITSSRSGGNIYDGTNKEEGSIKLYPNPTNSFITIEFTGISGNSTISITDISGKIIATRTTENKSADFDLSNAASGIYLVKVHISERIFEEKIVVKK